MRFGVLAVITAVEAVVASAASIALAVAGWGAWSIALGTLLGAVVSTGAVWWASRWRPTGIGSWDELRRVWSFSWNLFLANLVWFVAVGQADKAIIARALGLGPLGVYSFAQRAITYPLTSVSSVVGQVLYPALSRRQDDGPQMARILIRASAAVALVLLPAMVGLAAVADPLLPLVVGDGWDGLPLLVAVLAPAGAYQAVLGLANHVATAKGRPEITFRWHTVQAVVYIASFFVGLPWGITGVTIAYSAAIVLMAPGAVLIAGRLTTMRLRDYYAALLPAFVTSALVALVARSVLAVTGDDWSSVALAIASAVLAYAVVLFWWRPRPLADLLLMVRRRDSRAAR
jgi:PST family polysaccharide transporter